MLQRLVGALRQVFRGAMRPTYGSCSGDPIAWEQDALRRARERKPQPPGTPPIASAATTRTTNRRTLTVLVWTVLCLSGLVYAQRRFGFGEEGGDPAPQNGHYDGRFTFARLKYTTAPGGYWYRGLPAWAQMGYPLSEDNLIRIMNEITYLGGHTDTFNVFSLDDDELDKYPLAYITEAGWWQMTDHEGEALKRYLLKGGFVIFDDFKVAGTFGVGGGWEQFEQNITRIFPAARFVEMEPSHPIFHAFFEIASLDDFPQAYNAGRPYFRGLYEDNDPSKRLLMIVNYNTDISQYWEWSGRGLRPFDETNEAYKLGVNYLMYGMTH